MPLLTWVLELFPNVHQYYTAKEMHVRLQQCYSTEITLDAVYRAINCLKDREATSSILKPLDDARPAFYSPEAARSVARYLMHSTPPANAAEPVALSERAKRALSPEIPNSSQVETKFVANSEEPDIAA